MADPRRILIPMAAALAVAGAFGGPALGDGREFGFCQDGIQMGWNFYCDPKKQKPNKKPMPAPVAPSPTEEPKAEEPAAPSEAYPATAAIETARKELDELKNKAIIEPTPENLSAYMYAQKAMVDRAGAFADVWQRVLFKTPDLDANQTYPLSQMGGEVYQDQKTAQWEDALRQASANLGFLVVVSDEKTCQLCGKQLEIIKLMQQKYGIVPLVISKDGSYHPQYPAARVDTGQLAKMGLATNPTPFIALVEPKSGAVEPLGSGLVTEDIILERVYVITQVPAGTRYGAGAESAVAGSDLLPPLPGTQP